MGEVIGNALCRGVGFVVLSLVLVPAGLIFLGYLVYIAVMTVREFRRRGQEADAQKRDAAENRPGENAGKPLCRAAGSGAEIRDRNVPGAS